MQSIAHLGLPTLATLLAVFFILAMGQTLHSMYLTASRSSKAITPTVIYETLLSLHLIASTALVNAALSRPGTFSIHFWAMSMPLETLLWVNAAALVLGLALCVANRRPAMVPELVVLLACAPPMITLTGSWWWIVLLVDAVFFLVRIAGNLVYDARDHRYAVTRFSITEAVRKLPEGILCADAQGRVLFMNDTMRACLSELGFPTDLADTRGLWDALKDKADPSDKTLSEANDVCLYINKHETRLFSRDETVLHKKPCRRIIAVDVTVEETLNARIASTNRLLNIARKELEDSMEDVNAVAQSEALLNMQARVHDVVGQRLSILHRYLEDGEEDPETLAHIAPLLGSILDDLATGTRATQAETLAGIVNAFKLVGLNVNITGELPASETVASAFVRVVREAATNAIKHGQATNLNVNIAGSGGGFTLTVVNDGVPACGEIPEGTGLPGMRKAVSDVGGNLSVESLKPFMLRAVVPGEGSHS